MTRPLLPKLRRVVMRHRRALAATLAAAAVACALTALRPPEPHRVTVLVAASDLAGGTKVSRSDLETVALRDAALPSRAVRSPADVTGRTLAGPMRAGEPFTDAAFAGTALFPDGDLVATPIRIADGGIAGLLHAGDRIDVLAASTRGDSVEQPAATVADDVRVITVPRPGEGQGRALGPGASGEGVLVVVATTPKEAAKLGSAAVTSRLTIAMRSARRAG